MSIYKMVNFVEIKSLFCIMRKLLALIIGIVSIGLLPLLYFDHGSYFDFLTQQIPFILETKRMLASGTPWWSWNTFFGDNFIGAYSFYTVTSPFVYFVCLFPRAYILVGIVIALYLKFMAAGAAAYAFFKYVGFDKEKSILGGLCYVGSSFFIVNQYYHFTIALIVFPLLLLAIEKVFRNDKYAITFLSIISFLVVWINYYFALPSFLLGICYFIARYTSVYSQLKSSGKRSSVILKTVAGVSLGCILSALILLPTIFHVVGSGRDSLDLSFSTIGAVVARSLETIRIFVMPKMSEHEPDSFCSFHWQSNDFYLPVIGAIALMWCIAKWKELPKLKDIKWLAWLTIILVIASFTPLNRIFSAVSQAHYTRWYYGLTLFMIYAFLIIIERYKITVKQFWAYAIFTIALIIFMKLYNALVSYITQGEFTLTLIGLEIVEIFLCLVNMVFLWIFVKHRNVSRLILFVSCGAAINLMGFIYFNFRGSREPVDIFNKYIIDETLSHNDDNFEYRTDFNSEYLNLGILKNKPSTSTFHSAPNKLIRNLKEMTSEGVSSVLMIRKKRLPIDALMSVKEYIDYSVDPKVGGETLPDSVLVQKDSTLLYTRYEFKYYIPMGFSYDSYITRKEFEDYLSTSPKDSITPLLENLIIDSKDVAALSKLLRHATVTPAASLDSLAQARRRYCASKFTGDTRGLKMQTDFDQDRVVFVSVVADPGFKATIDGEATPIYNVNLGLSAIIVPKGCHQIDFDYTTPGLRLGCIITLLALVILLSIAYLERRVARGRAIPSL